MFVVLCILIGSALILQIVLFFIIRKRKKELREKTAILNKYNIKNRNDAFRALSESPLPDIDKAEIQKFYETY